MPYHSGSVEVTRTGRILAALETFFIRVNELLVQVLWPGRGTRL